LPYFIIFYRVFLELPNYRIDRCSVAKYDLLVAYRTSLHRMNAIINTLCVLLSG
jgi:hypothetical protein